MKRNIFLLILFLLVTSCSKKPEPILLENIKLDVQNPTYSELLLETKNQFFEYYPDASFNKMAFTGQCHEDGRYSGRINYYFLDEEKLFSKPWRTVEIYSSIFIDLDGNAELKVLESRQVSNRYPRYFYEVQNDTKLAEILSTACEYAIKFDSACELIEISQDGDDWYVMCVLKESGALFYWIDNETLLITPKTE